MQPARLTGKVALVTGSGRGIGRAVALKLAREGASVVANDVDAEPAKETQELITEFGGRAEICTGDVRQESFSQRFVSAAIDGFGGLDIIVNNAGYTWEASAIIHDGHRIPVGIRADGIKMLNRTIPAGRGGRPEEAAGAVFLLCTPESDYVSGQTLVCGGGYGSAA